MASSPIASWQIDGEKVETVADFIFLDCTITENSDCNHKIKRCFLGKKNMTNLDSILKIRDITLPTKVHIVKALVFPVVIYGCESWIIKKAERWRIDSFKLWCWRRLLRVPWTARRSNQSILKEINPEKAEGPILWPPDVGNDWRQKKKGETEARMVRWHHWLNGHEFEQTPGDSEGQGSFVCYSPWGHKKLNTN